MTDVPRCSRSLAGSWAPSRSPTTGGATGTTARPFPWRPTGRRAWTSSRRRSAADNGVTAIFRYAERSGRVYRGGWPVPGDLVFFRETYDLNRDGHLNDGLTHVGIVDTVSDDATVTIIHRVRRGVVRYRMNLNHPDRRTDPDSGRPINDYLRASSPQTKAQLTGQLFAAYATVLDGPGWQSVASR